MYAARIAFIASMVVTVVIVAADARAEEPNVVVLPALEIAQAKDGNGGAAPEKTGAEAGKAEQDAPGGRKSEPQKGETKKGEAKKREAKKAEPKRRPVPPAQTSGCVWLGHRVIQSLIRDDAVTAGDFQTVYRSFSCPVDHLKSALDCTVSVTPPLTAEEWRERVNGCWRDPNSAAIPRETVAPDAKQTTKSTPDKGKGTPNYPATRPKAGKAQ